MATKKTIKKTAKPTKKTTKPVKKKAVKKPAAKKATKSSFNPSNWRFEYERDSNFENNANYSFSKVDGKPWDATDEANITKLTEKLGFDPEPIMSGTYSIDYYTSDCTTKQLKDMGMTEGSAAITSNSELIETIKEQEAQDAKDRKSDGLSNVALPCDGCGDPACDGSCAKSGGCGGSCGSGGCGGGCGGQNTP